MTHVIVFCVLFYILNLSNAKNYRQHKKNQTESYYDLSDKADLIAEYYDILKGITTYEEYQKKRHNQYVNKNHPNPRLLLSKAQDREDLWLWENFFFGVQVSFHDNEHFMI